MLVAAAAADAQQTRAVRSPRARARVNATRCRALVLARAQPALQSLALDLRHAAAVAADAAAATALPPLRCRASPSPLLSTSPQSSLFLILASDKLRI